VSCTCSWRLFNAEPQADCCSCTQVVRRLHADAGWRAFYKGLVPEYLKVIPSVSIAFCTYEVLKSLLDL
jgi:Mitochondrial carrier protein